MNAFKTRTHSTNTIPLEFPIYSLDILQTKKNIGVGDIDIESRTARLSQI